MLLLTTIYIFEKKKEEWNKNCCICLLFVSGKITIEIRPTSVTTLIICDISKIPSDLPLVSIRFDDALLIWKHTANMVVSFDGCRCRWCALHNKFACNKRVCFAHFLWTRSAHSTTIHFRVVAFAMRPSTMGKSMRTCIIPPCYVMLVCISWRKEGNPPLYITIIMQTVNGNGKW